MKINSYVNIKYFSNLNKKNYLSSSETAYRLGVSTGIISQNKILLIRRENEPFKNKWCFPGGKIEKNEYYIDACKREILEETGLLIKLPEFHLLKIVYVDDYIIFSTISDLVDKNTDVINQREMFTYNKIIQKWFNIDEIKNDNECEFAPGILELIPKALRLYKLNLDLI